MSAVLLLFVTPAWAAASGSHGTTAGGKSTVRIYTSWGTARLLAIVIVIVAVIAIWLAGWYAQQQGAKYGGLFNGLDNRWSTSKVSILLWTIAILWAFVTLLLRFGSSAVPHTVPGAYFALLGIPSAAALGAKAVTNNQTSQGQPKAALEKPTNDPLKGLAQVLSDDQGSPDLLDSQYFLFNLVLLGYFVASFFHVAPPVGSDITLPALPGSLLALAGVSGATYVGKKALTGAPSAQAAGAAGAQPAARGAQGQGGGPAGAVAQTDPDFAFVGIPPIEDVNG